MHWSYCSLVLSHQYGAAYWATTEFGATSLTWTRRLFCSKVKTQCVASIFPLHIDGLAQDCSNSSALAMELLQSCPKPSICFPHPVRPLPTCCNYLTYCFTSCCFAIHVAPHDGVHKILLQVVFSCKICWSSWDNRCDIMWDKKQNVEQYYVEQYTIARRGFLINNRAI